MIIGLTGQTGAGKTTLCKFLKENSFEIIDCDKIAREVTAENSPLLPEIESAFEGVVENGVLNRRKLGEIVFSSNEKKKTLENILFPEIIKRVEEKISQLGGNIVLDAPTLFESGLNKICQKTLAVVADEEIRTQRIISRDNISKESAKLRINAGLSKEWLLKNCDAVVFNNTTETELINAAREVLKQWTKP